ncbi:hypothetical protein Ancab_004200 [Ancistrocladus abbreviatus]
MAIRFISLSSRYLFSSKQSLASIICRSHSSSSASTSLSLSSLSLLRLRPLASVATSLHLFSSPSLISFRTLATRSTQSSLNDSNPNWSNRPPKETILLDGCDFEHWLVVMEKPDESWTRDQIIDWYIKTLAKVVGSEEEARMKIYSVSTRHYFAFGCLVSEELSYKLKELEKVRWVLPDSYLDVKNKDYGGEPFINGQAVPYDPKYHEEWVRNNAKAMERNRRNDRPRNSDRSRNFERRRQNMQNQGFQGGYMPNQSIQNPASNMGGPPPNNMGGGGMPPNSMGGAPNMGGPAPNMTGMRPNMGGVPNNMGGMPPNNMGGAANMGGIPPNNMGGAPSMGGIPPNNMGGAPSMGGFSPNNMSGAPNMGGMPANRGGVPNAGWPGNVPNNGVNNMPNFQSSGGMQYQNTQMPNPVPNYRSSYPANTGSPSSGGNTNQSRDVPGRDMPPPNYQ